MLELRIAVLTLILALSCVFLAMWRERVRRRRFGEKHQQNQDHPVRRTGFTHESTDYGRAESPRERFLAGREQANHRAAQVLAGNRVASNNFAYTKGAGTMRKTVHDRQVLAAKPQANAQKRTQDDSLASLNDYSPASLFDNQAVADMVQLEREVAKPADDLTPGGGSFGGGGATGSWDAPDPSPDCSSNDTNSASSD